eukprot:Rhum_TRINITY_DN9858_c2_g1::Rhum_TRINITY_DN9858_c2_g1_i1::g.35687::m.35687
MRLKRHVRWQPARGQSGGSGGGYLHLAQKVLCNRLASSEQQVRQANDVRGRRFRRLLCADLFLRLNRQQLRRVARHVHHDTGPCHSKLRLSCRHHTPPHCQLDVPQRTTAVPSPLHRSALSHNGPGGEGVRAAPQHCGLLRQDVKHPLSSRGDGHCGVGNPDVAAAAPPCCLHRDREGHKRFGEAPRAVVQHVFKGQECGRLAGHGAARAIRHGRGGCDVHWLAVVEFSERLRRARRRGHGERHVLQHGDGARRNGRLIARRPFAFLRAEQRACDGDAVTLEHRPEQCARRVEAVKGKHVAEGFLDGRGGNVVQVSHDVQQLACGVGVVQAAGCVQRAKLRKHLHEAADDEAVDRRCLGDEKRELRLLVRILQAKHREDVATLPEQVVAHEGEPWWVRKHQHPELGVNVDKPAVVAVVAARAAATASASHNLSSVGQHQVPVFHKRLQQHDHFQRCLVRLVQDQAESLLHCCHERRVLPGQHTILQLRRRRKLLHSRVPVQLHVHPLPSERLQQKVGHPVLAHTLRPQKKHEPLPQREQLARNPLQRTHVLRNLHKPDVRNPFGLGGRPHATLHVADAHHARAAADAARPQSDRGRGRSCGEAATATATT